MPFWRWWQGRRRGAGAAAGAGPHCGRPHRREGLTLRLPLWYLAFTALAGGLESARESALTVFGQKTTQRPAEPPDGKGGPPACRRAEPSGAGGAGVPLRGDVDTVETLFTAGIISMAADACRILSILIVVWQCSRGLAYLLLALLPVLFGFTRFVQKRMLHNQLKNRKAVSRASGYVPETVRNLRTIRTLGKETYMETRHDGALGRATGPLRAPTSMTPCIPRDPHGERRCGGRGHAAVRLREAGGADAVRHDRRYRRDGDELHQPDLFPVGKSGHGDPDHPVRRGGCSPDQ
ncbi:MAG: ABC transporter transmembrane domain-containing protein [Dysosmobacter sp.]